MLSTDLKTQIVNVAEPLIRQFEGFWASPYRDQGGVWTIGYGTTRYPTGQSVAKGDPSISRATASGYLQHDVSKFLDRMEHLWTRTPTARQGAAMLSLTYNIGTEGFSHSTVLRQFNAGLIQAAADAFLMWNEIRHKKSDSLTKRREKERAVFLTTD